MKLKKLIPLIFVTLLGIYLRFVNISPYKFYPDSYQNLMVAMNISEHKSVVGTLGDGGSVYPPYFMWSRPIYPLLINTFNIFIKNLTESAYTVSMLTGILAIPMSYFLLFYIFRSRFAGMAAALLTAISYNHTVWSGYIMSETTGIFLSLLFFTLLFMKASKTSVILDFHDIFTGLILSLTVFSRYEYFLYIIPTVLVILHLNKSPLIKLMNIFSAFVFGSMIIFSALFPVLSSLKLLFNQTRNLVTGGIAATGITVLFLIYYPKLKNININKTLRKVIRMVFFASAIFSVIMTATPRRIPYFQGLSDFIKTDFILMILFFSGLGLFMKNKKHFNLLAVTVISFIFLQLFYTRVNPTMQRYTTHLLPFLLIPSAYSLNLIRNRLRVFAHPYVKVSFYLVFILISLIQMRLNYIGLKTLNKGVWFETSYEEVSAGILQRQLTGKEVLVASLPEAYYYFTNHPTVGIGQDHPYIAIKNFPGDTDFVIIDDMAMKDLYPGFTDFINKNLKGYKEVSYLTNTTYRYKTDIKKENSPVNVYRISKKDLDNKIESGIKFE